MLKLLNTSIYFIFFSTLNWLNKKHFCKTNYKLLIEIDLKNNPWKIKTKYRLMLSLYEVWSTLMTLYFMNVHKAMNKIMSKIHTGGWHLLNVFWVPGTTLNLPMLTYSSHLYYTKDWKVNFSTPNCDCQSII